MLSTRRWRHVIWSLVFASACTSPSPEKIRETLVRRPDILLDAIRAHPYEFVLLLDSVARGAESLRQARLIAEAERKVEEGFAHPRQPVLAHRIAFGDVNAPVTIVEYTDFECPYCREMAPTLTQVMRRYSGKVRLVVKQFPMDFHPHAMPAALMFEAIARQDPDRALRFYDQMYQHQERLATQGEQFVEEAARAVGADVARARQDIQGAELRQRVESDRTEALRFGFSGTPGFLINGVPLEGVQSLEAFARVIDRALGKGAL